MNEQVTDGMERLKGTFLQYKGEPVIVPHRMLGKMYVLDPTHPKTQSFLREVFETWHKWGVRYYMIDFLYSITGATPGTFLNDGYYDKTRIQGPEAWREGLRVIREAAGPDTYLLSSTGPTLQCIGYMDSRGSLHVTPDSIMAIRLLVNAIEAGIHLFRRGGGNDNPRPRRSE